MVCVHWYDTRECYFWVIRAILLVVVSVEQKRNQIGRPVYNECPVQSQALSVSIQSPANLSSRQSCRCLLFCLLAGKSPVKDSVTQFIPPNSLLPPPEKRGRDAREEEQNTAPPSAPLSPKSRGWKGRPYQRAIQSPQIAFVSKQIAFDAPIQFSYSTFPPTPSSMLLSCVVNASVDDGAPSPSARQSRYDTGFPIITDTTISAISTSPSMHAQARNGRMSSRRRIVVIMQ